MATEAPVVALTPDQRGQIDEFLGNPIKYPEEFKQWLTDYLATNVPPIPVSQLLGYKGTLARYEFVAAFSDGNTADERTWVDLGGPEITGMADGEYWAAWGCNHPGLNAGAATMRMGLSVNGADPTTYTQATTVDNGLNVWRADQLTVKNGTDNNSILAKYYYDLSGGGDGEFQRRWMVVLRVT